MNLKCYIDGKLVDGKGGVAKVINPGNEEVVGSVSLLDKSQTQACLVAAKKGFEYWSALPVAKREEWIEKLKAAIIARKDDLVNALMMETGKVYAGAVEDFEMLVDCLEYFPKEARNMGEEIIDTPSNTHVNRIIKEPVGVVVAYLAWNFPLLNVGYKLGPALASGCSIIIKPAEVTPLATLMVGEIMESIDFPAGVVNFVLGKVPNVAEVLNTSTIPAMITLIGSTNTGKLVVDQSLTSIKKYSLELGGNAPAIVLKDYDEKKAADTLTNFKFANAGQVCVSPNRVFVHEDQYESFLERAGSIANGIKPGWGREEGAGISPMITEDSRQRILGIIKDALDKGARVISGGKVPEEMAKGYYVEPTVLADVTPDMECYKNEIFGPIMPVIKYDDSLDLVEAGNDTEYGLASYLFTEDEGAIEKFARGIKSGTLCVNQPIYSVELPHGGTKNSGIGKDCSKFSLEEYYYIKRVSVLKG